MACGIKVIAAFLACATAASALIAPFPHGKTTVYKYRTVVKTTNTAESLYASQFVLQGTLDIIHDVRDPKSPNAFTIVMSNLTTDMHNGRNEDYEKQSVPQSLDIAWEYLEKPFQIIYNNDGTFQDFTFSPRQMAWSWNMKMALTAMLQLDIPHINMQKSANESLTFVTQENTIYGVCSVTYKVHPIDRVNKDTEELRVNKKFSAIDCSDFAYDEINNVDNDHCKAKKPENIFTENTRDIVIEKQGGAMLIKKLVADSSVKVLSANGASYPFYVITNTTFDFLEVKEKSVLPTFVDGLSKQNDLIYWTAPRYVVNDALDVAQGRHVLKLSSLSTRLEKLLNEAFDYIENNHLSPTEMNWSHAQTINKIFRTMRYMDTESLQKTFDVFDASNSRRAMQIKNIFFGIVAQVGTEPAFNLTLNMIFNNKISATTAVDMLGRLPLSVKAPTRELLIEMQKLTTLDDSIPADVRKAGILSFSTFVYKRFKHKSQDDPILQGYLKEFFDHIKDEENYETKVIYLMAIKNIQVGRIYNILEPIINGSQVITEDPERFRLLAIWAIDKAVEEDYDDANRILWNVMTNNSLSTKLRIAAYEILMKHAPDGKSARKVHDWVMTSDDTNEHFRNYHYTTLDSIAKSANQCKNNLRTTVRSILKEMNYSHPYIRYPLSGVQSVGYIDESFIHAEKFDLRTIVNELSGVPEVVQIELETVDRNGAVSDVAVQMHIEGNQDLSKTLRPYFDRSLTPPEILELLQKASKSVPARKDLKIDIVLKRNDRVILANHYDLENLSRMHEDIVKYCRFTIGTNSYNYQSVVFHRLYEKRMTSDVGVPVVVEDRDPIVTSIKFNHTNKMSWPFAMNFDLEFKRWEHQDHSLSVYNPIKDVWHAVRAVTINEVTLPILVNITEKKFQDYLKLSFPERLQNKPSAAGSIVFGKHMVTVDEEETQALSESCNTCLNQEDIHDRIWPVDDNDKYREEHYDLNSIGLGVTTYRYSGNNAWMTESDLGHTPNWDTSFRSEIPNSWASAIVKRMMDVRRQLKNAALEGYQNDRGSILRIEPSTNFSISQIEIRLRGKYEDHDKNEKSTGLAHADTWKFSVSLDMISRLTNTSAGLWNLDVDVHNNRGHLKKTVSVKIVRKIPEQQNLKICVDASKHYPAQPSDYLMLRGTNQDIDSEIIIAYGYGFDEECQRNETLISLNSKAQLSDEQMERLERDLENSPCSKDTKNPLFANPMNLVPRTMNCLNEAIRYTTPRKYTYNVTYKLEPNTPIDHFVFLIPYDEEYGTRANVQMLAEFPMDTNSAEFEIVANSTSVTKSNILFKNILGEGQGPVMRPNWDFPLDNSRFGLQFLDDYNDDKIRLCTVYPRIILRENISTWHFTIPSDEWTLISGDHYDKQFAIFAQQTRPDYLSFILFIQEHKIHFFTRESDNKLVAVADEIEPEIEEDFQLPSENEYLWRLKVTKNNDDFVVRMRHVPLTLRVGSNYIVLEFASELQGRISGLCGHLNGHRSSKSDVFSIKGIETIAMENANEDKDK